MMMESIKRPLLTAVFLLAGILSACADDGFMPFWQVGSSWAIEASRLRQDPQGTFWTTPARWLFEVKNEKEIDGVACFVVHVSSAAKHSAGTQAILCLSKQDLRAVRVVDVAPVGGKPQAHERRYDGSRISPLFSGESVIPYDLPMFPLAAASGDDAREHNASVAGEAATDVDGITFVDATAQNWTKTEQGYRVTLDSGDSRGKLVQEWVAGEPWARSMTGRDVKYTLVTEGK
ncbi:hypothetical protein KBA41_13825 [Candidatus Ozemobacteraceae bacterium]|nr:hypothetical protein [Candidatus Ozemobacteraceae bacterium]